MILAVLVLLNFLTVESFCVPRARRCTALRSSNTGNAGVVDEIDDTKAQWALFQKHHIGCWKGVWTTYDYLGDVLDETVASVNVEKEGDVISQSHTIVVGASRSDCATCFDSFETKTMHVASYTPENLRKSRFAANGMVNGPTLLRSGAMATELVLSFGDGRVRVTFQHGPVWERGVEPGSCPPQGLKLIRVMIAREAKRDTAPTAETEAAEVPGDGNPVFFRPVPPFNWHKKWGGSSWTWGPSSGNRGWSIEELEGMDMWHGNAPTELWNLRLPGGLFVQCPRIVAGGDVSLLRCAWLPTDQDLLRVEAGILALAPMDINDDSVVGFAPPSLASLRCDVLKNRGDLPGEPLFASG